jgi:putative ABC transport system substrate-binding protein
MQRTRRRRFLLAAGALAAAPLRAMAAPPRRERQFRIGFGFQLLPERALTYQRLLGELGWMRGRDYAFVDSGIPFGPDVEVAALRIVRQEPDLIVVIGTAFARAVQRLTRTIPVVMYTSGYPVAAGVARTLSRPGMNVTGNTSYAGTAVWGRLLQLLAEVKPGTRRIGLVWDYLPPQFAREEIDYGMNELLADARALDLTLEFAEIREASAIEVALTSLESRQVQALLVTAGPTLGPIASRVTRFALANGLPSVMDAHLVLPVEPAPLLVFGPPVDVLTRQTAAYVDRILRGSPPGELPIQQPARFELVVNLRTARLLRLELPQSLLLRADRVIG